MSSFSDKADAPLWNSSEAVRFTDVDLLAWRVVECDASALPGARGPRCLIYFSEAVVRRVWIYPLNWRTLTAVALEALMYEA